VTGLPGVAVALLLGYLLGSLPFGVLIGRAAGGVDPLAAGSGRTGATNLLRTVGVAGALATLVLDLGKGLAAVLIAEWLFRSEPGAVAQWVAAGAGAAAVAGHIRSVFIGFRGGRGVAPFAGAMLATAPWAVVAVVPVFVLIVWRTRFVSLGSLAGSLLAAPVTAVLVPFGAATWAGVALGVGGAAMVTAAHADNISRLRAGTERRIGR
jgi:acyl phosphate:glycerol-3-phosphate acyltransferase